MVKHLWPWGKREPGTRDDTSARRVRLEAERGRRLVEESREIVLVLDEDERVIAASRRARESIAGLELEGPLPNEVLRTEGRHELFRIPYEVAGRRETLLYLRDTGDLAAYEELRAGFTAAVSHELRTPLARLLALLETALLPGSDVDAMIDQARAEIGQIGELIDDVLFLSELESGREVVALGGARPLPILREVVEGLRERSVRAAVAIDVVGDAEAEVPLRPRMIRVIGENLAENALRYAGPGARFTFSIHSENGSVVLEASDDGEGVDPENLPRLFERFYRADEARSSRGTGLGLAIVKHVVASAGGTVEARGGRGAGLAIRCTFPATQSS
ncbi:MAG: HAMP domain-containing histidine kinase [Actinomycetota bacterium]|nr:HAMP domain-containing histidine kinase [Actinomycetota bacterium]